MKSKERQAAQDAARFTKQLENAQRANATELILPSWLTIEGLTGEKARQAVSAAQEWAGAYGVEREIVIKPLPKNRRRIIEEGIAYTYDGYAAPGVIELADNISVRNTVIHEMTHAVSPDEPLLFADPISIPQGAITGIHGLTVMIRNHDGKEIQFTPLEEGMVERNASFLGKYHASEQRYFEVGILTRNLFPPELFPNAHNWSKSNNIEAFLIAMFHPKETTDIIQKYLLTAMDIYREAWLRR